MTSLLDSFLSFAYFYLPFLCLERILPSPVGHERISNWWLKFSFLVAIRIVLFVAVLPFLVRLATWKIPNYHSVIQPVWDHIPIFAGVAATYLIFSFMLYWSHRLRHECRPFWRLHQMHHSPRRFDLSLTPFAHPLDMLSSLFLMFAATLLCALPFQYIWFVGAIHRIFEESQHLNIKTPRWLGYIFVRPEQHSWHHRTHDVNFGIIPLWDLVFGTFSNPLHASERVGFAKESEKQFWRMFFFKIS